MSLVHSNVFYFSYKKYWKSHRFNVRKKGLEEKIQYTAHKEKQSDVETEKNQLFLQINITHILFSSIQSVVNKSFNLDYLLTFRL